MSRPKSRQVGVRVFGPPRGWALFSFTELIFYRELLFFLIWRDVKVRYKQTVLGFLWAVAQPFFTMVVFSVVFGRLADIPSDGIPYPVFSYAALLPWQLFSRGLTDASSSLVTNRTLLTRVYFPRLYLPTAAIGAGLVDFAIAFTILIAMMVWYDIVPTIAVLALPLLVLLAAMTSLSIGIWLSGLNARYRDIRLVLPFISQLWLFLTPIAYPASLVPEPWRTLSGLNPMSGVVEGFRWALLGRGGAPEPLVFVSAVVVLGLFVSGLVYFHRQDRSLADVV